MFWVKDTKDTVCLPPADRKYVSEFLGNGVLETYSSGVSEAQKHSKAVGSFIANQGDTPTELIFQALLTNVSSLTPYEHPVT
jgi:hypothetical protein